MLRPARLRDCRLHRFGTKVRFHAIWQEHLLLDGVQGDHVGINTGNGEKLSDIRSRPGLALLGCSFVSLHLRCFLSFVVTRPCTRVVRNSLGWSIIRRLRASSAAYKNIQLRRVNRSCWQNLANAQKSAALFNWPTRRSVWANTLLLWSWTVLLKFEFHWLWLLCVPARKPHSAFQRNPS